MSCRMNNIQSVLSCIFVGITDECNLNCRYCFVKKNKGYLNPKYLIHFVKNHGKHINEITIFGGEPLLYIDIVEDIIKYIPDKNFRIVTNGTINPDFLLERYSNIIGIQISIDGIKECHNTNRCGSWNDVYDLSKYLKQKFGSKIFFNSVLAPNTIKYFVDNINFFQHEFNTLYFPCYSGIFSDKEKEVLKKVVLENKRTIFDYLNKFNGLRVCGAGCKMLFMSPSGDLWFCHSAYHQSDSYKYWLGDYKNGIVRFNAISNVVKHPMCVNCNVKLCRSCYFEGNCSFYKELHKLVFS